MFVDEITIKAKAGDGGDGVVRWRHEKFRPMAGPSGGNGGKGGNIVMKAVSDLNRLAKYTGAKEFTASNGGSGLNKSQYGKNGEDLVIEVPVGSLVFDRERDRTYEFTELGQEEIVLKGGGGGLGNEHFKSATNRSPENATLGREGERAELEIILSLVVDVGLVGLPNAGKSTLLNQLTNANSRVGDFPFTTTEPHLGAMFEFTIADIPGLIEGAADGKGLGHKFLRHIEKTKMILHLVSLIENNPIEDYKIVRREILSHKNGLENKNEWIIFTKKDLVDKARIDTILSTIDTNENRVFVISAESGEGVKELKDELVKYLRES